MVPDGDICQILIEQEEESLELFAGLTEEQWDFAYAPGKWTIREIYLHMMDAERVFCYRALRISRGDQTALAGFDQDQYVPMSEASSRTTASMLAEYRALRASTIALLQNFSPEMYERVGTASDSQVSVRALAYIIVGHERSHLTSIKEKYLG